MNETAAKTILICDTQPVAVEGVRGLLGHCDDLRFAGAVASLEAAFELCRGLNPACVVIDKFFGTPAIIDWLLRFGASGAKSSPVIWGLGINESEALRFLQSGSRGVLRRSSEPEMLLTCLRSVTSGNTWLDDGIFAEMERPGNTRRSQLTPREIEVADLVEKGLRNRDIATNLGIQTGTVKIHLKHIFEKTGVRGRYGLALSGLREKGAVAATQVC
ncbi:MAG TPA: response regulator transcription factor [Bryobacteraceae bacterium]|jgi:DNA-binding NarL/FixJ family response regulator|nr:response regulator transcription factor [Bryobacteraceae bacterium]